MSETGTRTGQVDHFEIRRFLARGAMGEVYEAYEPSLDRTVALKFLTPELCSDEVVVQRFKREARAAAALNHPNIVAVIFSGEHEQSPYFAMEFVEGSNLAELVAKGALEPAEAVSYAIQAARGLRAAYVKGRVHRDIKPANLLVTADGTVKIADFGLVKEVAGGASLTTTGLILGTPLYMSPEQARGGAVDFHGDVYSLGATLHCLLAGAPPFTANSPLDVLVKHMNEKPPDLETLRPGLPSSLCATVRRMLAKEPGDRFDDYDELLGRLDRDAAALAVMQQDGPPLDATAISKGSANGSDRGGGETVVAAGTASPSGGSSTGLAALVVLLALVVGIIAMVVDRRPTAVTITPLPGKPYAGQTIANGVGMKLVWVPAGSFTMGSPVDEAERQDDELQHQVTLTSGFWIGKFEVVQEEWLAVMGSNPSKFVSSRYPVDGVSWNDSVEFCKKLSALERRSYRLPTEAQWEYACRAGTKGPRYGEPLGTLGFVRDDSGLKTHTVGQRRPNAFGLFDMFGNVYEWCRDYYGPYSADPQKDPQGPAKGSNRVRRGGCLSSSTSACRAAYRHQSDADYHTYYTGFRVVIEH